MDMLKEKFGSMLLWRRIEGELAVLVSGIPEASTEEKKEQLIKSLRDVKDFLVKNEISPEELDFLDEEIERYAHTKQISLYEEKEDQISQEDIKRYSRQSAEKEGIVGIHLNYNYEQLRRLTNGVYSQTGLVKFFISREKTIYGKIVAEIYEHPQNIPIATLVQKKQKDDAPEPPELRIALFGEKVNYRQWDKIKEVESPFWVYRFISEHNQELYLLSINKVEIGDYIVTGVTTQIDDYKALTDSTKLPTKLPYMFVQSIKNRIIKFKDHGEFKERLRYLNITKKTMFNVPFSIWINNEETGKKEHKILKHPLWFKWLVWAWLCHAPIGMENKYPMHLLIAGPPNSGKSLMLNRLHSRSKEFNSVFSGSSSTLKRLIPSFKRAPAEMGYLAESNRFAFCDEFFRAFIRTRTGANDNQREESVAMMNDMLEHQKREAGSGVSKVNVNMTARVMATTNPIREVNNVEDMLTHLDRSFLSRWLIYWQSKKHVDMVRRAKQSELKDQEFDVSDNDWISLLDYLHTFRAKYNGEKLEEIFEEPIEMLPSDLKEHYLSRHRHHLQCLLDGVVKARCMFDHDNAFSAQEQDYDRVKKIWGQVISSWVDTEQIKQLPIEKRAKYLPEHAQYLFNKICDAKKPLSRIDTEELAMKGMNRNEYIVAVVILRDNQLINEEDGLVRPYYMKKDDEPQQRL